MKPPEFKMYHRKFIFASALNSYVCNQKERDMLIFTLLCICILCRNPLQGSGLCTLSSLPILTAISQVNLDQLGPNQFSSLRVLERTCEDTWHRIPLLSPKQHYHSIGKNSIKVLSHLIFSRVPRIPVCTEMMIIICLLTFKPCSTTLLSTDEEMSEVIYKILCSNCKSNL